MNYNYAIFDRLGAALETRNSRTVITPTATSPASLATLALAGYPKASGKWRASFLCWGDEALSARIGIASVNAGMATALGGDADGYGLDIDGKVYTDGIGADTGTTFRRGDIVDVLLDITTAAPSVTWYINKTKVYTQPLANVGPWMLAVSLACDVDYGVQCFMNSGQRRFEFDIPGADGWYAPVVGTQGVRLADTDFLDDQFSDTPNLRWNGLLSGGQTQGLRSLDFWPWQRGVQSGAMTIGTLNDGHLDEMLNGSVRDMSVTVLIDDGTGDDRATLYTAVVDTITAKGDGMVEVTCRDPLALLQVPLQRWMIRPDADPNSANSPRPILLGACRNVPVKSIDAINYVYAGSDNPMMGIGFCRVSGYPLDPSAGDFTLNDGKIDITLASQPDGIVTLDASSIGGQQLPDVTTDIYGGAGDPFAGSPGATPTGWDDTGADVTGAEPVIGYDALTFPVVRGSPDIYVKMPVSCVGVTGSCALRIQWLDVKGDVIREKLSTEYTGTTSPTYIDAEVFDTLPARGVAARVQAVAFDHTSGAIRVGDIEAYYAKWGARTTVGGLVDADFSSGDLNGWDASGDDPSRWSYQSTSGIDRHTVTMDNAFWTGEGSSYLINTGRTAILSEGARINATCKAALRKLEDRYHPTAQIGILWYDSSDKVIGWTFSDGLYKGHKGYYSTLSVAGYAPAGVSYARLALLAGMSNNNDGTYGPRFADCAWDYVAVTSGPAITQKTRVDIGTFADPAKWTLGDGWTFHSAGSAGPGGNEYAEHTP